MLMFIERQSTLWSNLNVWAFKDTATLNIYDVANFTNPNKSFHVGILESVYFVKIAKV